MRALLDTNIVIHRESRQATNYSIGNLFYWLDKLRYEKLIHPYTVNELHKANNDAQQEIYTARLSAYTQMRSVAPMSAEFQSKISNLPKSANDEIDYQLLYEVFCGRADILITEDRKMRERASLIGISDKVFSIDGFITKCTNENPALVEYKSLSVKKELFGAIDINDSFFDSFRTAYPGFNNWFAGKCDEEAYICRSDANKILGFLYIKTEDQSENYSDIIPSFAPGKRLKVGTFKVESTGFRLGERFIKIIFDNAIARQVDEIYVTLFVDRPELQALDNLLLRWGFYHHGVKRSNGKEELVLVKKLGQYDDNKSVIANFPNLKPNNAKMILPIYPQYHTPLFPDSILNNEVEYVGNVSHRYALEKAYITWGNVNNVKPGYLLLFYRTGETYPKKYSSVVTTVGVVHEIVFSFRDENDFLKHCQNRTVFSKEELKRFWNKNPYNLSLLKFVYVKSLSTRLTLSYLWDHGIVNAPNGPRPFTKITDEQFDMILRDSNTILYK